MVDAAAQGSVVEVPGGCVYRETLVVDKPLTLRAGPGTEIRGSEVWTEWSKSGSYWLKGPLPALYAHGTCRAETDRCRRPQQVFLDGRPLEQVPSNPKSGQFAMDERRWVVLADDPAGRTVEVTTRKTWIDTRSSGVSIEGFTMKHAANDSQQHAPISNNGHDDWTLQHNTLSDTHGAVVSLAGGDNVRVISNDISRGGQLGIHGTDVTNGLIEDNTVHRNNTEGYAEGWEAGGVKTSTVDGLVVEGNEVYANEGKALWCDVFCRNVVYSDNQVHHNEGMGILFELGSGAEIFDNELYENGWEFAAWGWGGGIVSSSSHDVEIHRNTLAWNADGIAVISSDRKEAEYDIVRDVRVHHNAIVSGGHPGDEQAFSLGWLQDWDGVMFEEGSNNRGWENNYWPPASHPEAASRFEWDGVPAGDLAQFNATPGEENGRHMTDEERDRILASKIVPASPEPRK